MGQNLTIWLISNHALLIHVFLMCMHYTLNMRWTKLQEWLKVDNETDYPESKCFRNISVVAASMVMEIFKKIV